MKDEITSCIRMILLNLGLMYNISPMVQTLKVEEITVPVQTLIDQGILFASSPLLRGNPPPSHIVQVVTRRADGSFYGLGYRQPLPGEVKTGE